MNNIESSTGRNITVLRGRKGSRDRAIIAGTIAQQAYAKLFAAVDLNDRDSADYLTAFRSHQYYLRVMAWVLDRVIHTIFVVVYFVVIAPGSSVPMLGGPAQQSVPYRKDLPLKKTKKTIVHTRTAAGRRSLSIESHRRNHNINHNPRASWRPFQAGLCRVYRIPAQTPCTKHAELLDACFVHTINARCFTGARISKITPRCVTNQCHAMA